MKLFWTHRIRAAACLFVLWAPVMAVGAKAAPLDRLKPYHLVWTTPSTDPRDSMPLGNGDIGVNVWVENSGDLVLYVGKTDAWDGYSRLLKLARVRVRLSPTSLLDFKQFEQILDLVNGEVTVKFGQEPDVTQVRIWVDASAPAVRIEAHSSNEFNQDVILETWRTERRQLKGIELHSACGMYGRDDAVYAEPDTIVKDKNDSVVWYHHNQHSIWKENLSIIGIYDFVEASDDPLMHQIFGGCISGEGFVKKDDVTLSKTHQNKSAVAIYVNKDKSTNPSEWVTQIRQMADADAKKDVEESRVLHRKWWNSFWERSWIFASGSKEAEEATELYILNRYLNACAGRGNAPIKFNGSLFTVHPVTDRYYEKVGFDADFRLWGGGYFWQNTRLIYWTMLKSGDYEMIKPLFEMYMRALPLVKERTRRFQQHGGVCFPEHMYFWGTQPNSDYGWEHDPKGLGKHEAVRYYWQGGLELVTMMLDYYDYTQDRDFAVNTLVPMAQAITEFYDQHYVRGKDGKIVFEPAQSLETWLEAVNPLPEIAGLKFITSRLSTLPQDAASIEQKQKWKKLYDEIPELPGIFTFHVDNYRNILSPGAKIGNQHNVENPQLYAVFPYRLFGVGKPDIEMARVTYEYRHNRGNVCWTQDEIFAAHLGYAEDAKKGLAVRVSNKDKDTRFAAFARSPWETFPDIDGGAVMMIAFQAMLIQDDGERIFVLPAWPREWDVAFKLHAPRQTVVEGRYSKGKVEYLNVTPSLRRSDVTVTEPGNQ